MMEFKKISADFTQCMSSAVDALDADRKAVEQRETMLRFMLECSIRAAAERLGGTVAFVPDKGDDGSPEPGVLVQRYNGGYVEGYGMSGDWCELWAVRARLNRSGAVVDAVPTWSVSPSDKDVLTVPVCEIPLRDLLALASRADAGDL